MILVIISYQVRIAAVSQEHVLVCINTQCHTARKLHGFSVGIEIDFVVWVVDIDVISVRGIGVDLISVWGSELTSFCVGVENDMVWSLDPT